MKIEDYDKTREEQVGQPIQVYRFIARAEKARIQENEKKKEKYYLFSQDLNEKSAKVYYISTINAWSDYILSKPKQERSSYCLITSDPIIGYIDLEFSKELNPNKNISKMIEILFIHLKKIWKKYYSNLEELKEEDFLILTASNEKKESFHIHGPFNYAFKDQFHFNIFLYLVNQSMLKDEKDSKNILIKINEKKEISFIDLSPYKHHSSLRMFSCSKINDYRPLILSNLNKMKIENEKELFESSIIHNVSNNLKILEFKDEKLKIEILPKIFKKEKFKEKKEFKNLLTNFGNESNFESCSHFNEFKDKKEDFKLIENIDYFYELIVKNLKLSFTIREKMTEKTIMILEIKDDKFIGKQYFNHYLKEVFLQSIIDYFDMKENCYLFSFLHGFRIIWPNIKINLSDGSKILKDISILLKEKIPKYDWEKLISDVYSKKFISFILEDVMITNWIE
eukprot:gene5100-8699_t